jgi:hypothetical protein
MFLVLNSMFHDELGAQLGVVQRVASTEQHLRIQPVPQGEHQFSIININWLIFFQEIIRVYIENPSKR